MFLRMRKKKMPGFPAQAKKMETLLILVESLSRRREKRFEKLFIFYPILVLGVLFLMRNGELCVVSLIDA